MDNSDGRFDTEQVCREVETLHNANAGFGVIRTLLSASTPTRRPATSVKVANLVKRVRTRSGTTTASQTLDILDPIVPVLD